MFRFDNSSVQTAIFLIMLAIATFGFLSRIKKGLSIFELFFPTYLVAIVLVPSWQGLRFLVPVIPLYIFYFICGLERITLSLRKPAWLVQAIPLLFSAALLVYYADIYRDFLPLKTDVFSQAENRQLLEFVRSETTPEDVIAFHKPRALALFTNRKSVVVPVPDPHGDIFGRLSALGVDVVIVRLDALEEFQPQWRQLIAEHPEKFAPVFENAAFRVYRINTKGKN